MALADVPRINWGDPKLKEGFDTVPCIEVDGTRFLVEVPAPTTPSEATFYSWASQFAVPVFDGRDDVMALPLRYDSERYWVSRRSGGRTRVTIHVPEIAGQVQYGATAEDRRKSWHAHPLCAVNVSSLDCGAVDLECGDLDGQWEPVVMTWLHQLHSSTERLTPERVIALFDEAVSLHSSPVPLRVETVTLCGEPYQVHHTWSETRIFLPRYKMHRDPEHEMKDRVEWLDLQCKPTSCEISGDVLVLIYPPTDQLRSSE